MRLNMSAVRRIVCSFLYSPGLMKHQNWNKANGALSNIAASAASFNGVNTGDVTWVAMTLSFGDRVSSKGLTRA